MMGWTVPHSRATSEFATGRLATVIFLSRRRQHYVGAPFTLRFGVLGSQQFETGPRPHKVLGSNLINFRESL